MKTHAVLPAFVRFSLLTLIGLTLIGATANAADRPAEPAAGPGSPAPARPEVATLAAGCFWGTEEFFRKVPGVLETRVGYTGGHLQNPTYEDTSAGTSGDAESLELKFDPTRVSYAELLTLFFKMHDPTPANRQGNDVGSQYRS